VYFLFALMTTAFVFGLYETVLTSLVSAGFLVFQETVVAFGPAALNHLMYVPLNVSRLVLRCVFLLMAGILLGYLAEREKELRAEIALTNYLLSQARVGNRLSEALVSVSAELARFRFPPSARL